LSGSRGWAELYVESGLGSNRAYNILFRHLLLGGMACVQLPPNSEGGRTIVVQSDLLVVITGAGVANPSLLDHDVDVVYISLLVGLIRPKAKSFSLTIPSPLAEQHRIAAMVDKLMDLMPLYWLDRIRCNLPFQILTKGFLSLGA